MVGGGQTDAAESEETAGRQGNRFDAGFWLWSLACAFDMLSRGAELICFMIVLVAFFSVGVLSGWRAWAEARVHWFTLHSVSREMVSGRVPFVMVNL